MDKEQRFQDIEIQDKPTNDVQRSIQKNTPQTTTNDSGKKKSSEKLVNYIVICFVSLLLFLLLRVINDPDKYKWCDQNGWPGGIRDCFTLGIEHFIIDASSLILLCISISFAIIAVIIFSQKTKDQTNS